MLVYNKYQFMLIHNSYTIKIFILGAIDKIHLKNLLFSYCKMSIMQVYDKSLFSNIFLRESVVLQNRSNVIIPQYMEEEREKGRKREGDREPRA